MSAETTAFLIGFATSFGVALMAAVAILGWWATHE